MKKETLFSKFKVGFLTLLVFGLIIFGVGRIIKGQKEFRVVHNLEVPAGQYGPDGRAAVGAPESYDVMASGALLWNLTKKNNKVFIIIGWVLIFIGAAYIGAAAIGYIEYKDRPIFVILIISAACFLGAYSSAFGAEQKVRLSPDQYNTIKDSKVELTKLFTSKPIIL